MGQGAKWSADRSTAWELQFGEAVRSIPLDEAAKIASSRAAAALRMGLRPP